jgi:hypothetical protein
MLAVSLGCSQVEGTPGRVNHRCISPEKETLIYVWFGYKGANTSSGLSVKIPICADGD